MDRIAIISDVHGNIVALESVLDDIKKRGINKIFCLGDSIFKCNHPDLVVDRLKEVCEVILIGNSDEAICNPNVKNKNFWTRNILGEERVEYLYNLPKSHEFYMSGHLIRLFHASPYSLIDVFNPMYKPDIELFNKPMIYNPDRLFDNTEFIGKSSFDKTPDIVCYGHIHTPLILRHKNKTILNPGSIGIPTEMSNEDINSPDNKFSTLSSYMIIEGDFESTKLSGISFQLVRIPYDVSAVITELENSDMPNKKIVIQTLKSAIPTTYN